MMTYEELKKAYAGKVITTEDMDTIFECSVMLESFGKTPNGTMFAVYNTKSNEYFTVVRK